jgi:hypothetical protein
MQGQVAVGAADCVTLNVLRTELATATTALDVEGRQRLQEARHVLGGRVAALEGFKQHQAEAAAQWEGRLSGAEAAAAEAGRVGGAARGELAELQGLCKATATRTGAPPRPPQWRSPAGGGPSAGRSRRARVITGPRGVIGSYHHRSALAPPAS